MADSSLLDSVDASNLQRPPRSAGLHMSTLLRALYPPKASGDIDEEQLSIYGLLGLAFEDRAELALLSLAKEDDWPYTASRPGEVDWCGVKGSPDILLVPKPAWQDELTKRELSLKVKWRSSGAVPREPGENQFASKWDYELSQCMAYSDPLGTDGAILMVYFVCGNWKGAKSPEVLAWELDFERREVEETMQALATIALDLAS